MNLNEKAVLVAFTASKFNPRKRDEEITSEVHAARHCGREGVYIKNVFKEATDPIASLITDARQFHYRNTLPWSRDGLGILPTANYMRYMETIRDYKARLKVMVDKLVTEYDQHIAAEKVRKNGMFRLEDYPAKSELATAFSIDADLFPVPAQGDFRVDIPGEALKEMQGKLNDIVTKAEAQAKTELWKRLLEPLAHLVSRLSDPDARKLYDSLVGNLKEVCQLMPHLDISGDPRLAEMTKEVERFLDDVDMEDVREDRKTRKAVAAQANSILAKMKGIAI